MSPTSSRLETRPRSAGDRPTSQGLRGKFRHFTHIKNFPLHPGRYVGMQISDALGIQLFQIGTISCWKDDRCFLADMYPFLYPPIYHNTAWPYQCRYLLEEQLPFFKFPLQCLELNLYCSPVSLLLFQWRKISFNRDILVCILHRSLKSFYDFIKNPHIYIQMPVTCVGAPQHRVNQLMNEKTQWRAVTTSDKNEGDIVLVFQLKKLGRPPTKMWTYVNCCLRVTRSADWRSGNCIHLYTAVQRYTSSLLLIGVRRSLLDVM